MATVKGVWKFNSKRHTDGTFEENVNVQTAGELTLYTKIKCAYSSVTYGYWVSVYYDNWYGLSDCGEFYDSVYNNGLDFGSAEQSVSDTFYNWLTENATQQTTPEEEKAISSTVYNFDTESQTIVLSTNGSLSGWLDSTSRTYYAIIPLEIGKKYKVALQNVTNLARFRVALSDTDAIGGSTLTRYGGNHTGAAQDGLSMMFVAEENENFLICYGGNTNGGEVLVTCMSAEPEATATVITYNGSTIATLEAGQTATIKTAETEVEHDIVVIAGGAKAEEVESTHALYNGVRLPKIPEDVLAQYPYCWIRNNTRTGFYDLLLSKDAWYLQDANTLAKSTYDTMWYQIAIVSADTATVWANNQTFSSMTWGNESDRRIMWSNHDIPNGSATSTDIYFEGTEPVPIEEEPEEPTTAIEITYNGEVIASLGAGQTATVKCANTEADFDIVVSAKAEEDDSIVGTWVFKNDGTSLDISMLSSTWSRLIYSDSPSDTVVARVVYGTFDLDITLTGFSQTFGTYYGIQLRRDGYPVETVWSYLRTSDGSDHTDFAGDDFKRATLYIYKGNYKSDDAAITFLKANATKQ